MTLFADRLTIEGDGTPHGSRVLLDGEQLHGVTGFTLSADVATPSMSLQLNLIGKPRVDLEATV